METVASLKKQLREVQNKLESERAVSKLLQYNYDRKVEEILAEHSDPLIQKAFESGKQVGENQSLQHIMTSQRAQLCEMVKVEVLNVLASAMVDVDAPDIGLNYLSSASKVCAVDINHNFIPWENSMSTDMRVTIPPITLAIKVAGRDHNALV